MMAYIPCFSAVSSTSVGQMCPLQFISDSGLTLRTNSISYVQFWMKPPPAHSVEPLIQHRFIFCCKNSCRMDTKRTDNLIIPLATVHFTILKQFSSFSVIVRALESLFTKGFCYVVWKSKGWNKSSSSPFPRLWKRNPLTPYQSSTSVSCL